MIRPALLALLLATPAAAQPWRVEKDGAVIYTSNIDDLPPAMKARVIAQRKQAAEEAAERAAERAAAPTPPPETPAEAPVAPQPPARPGRIQGLPARAAGTPTPPSRGPKPVAAKPPPPPKETAAERRARLTAELSAAREALQAARREALLVPDGRTYARRNEAEARVKALEAELAAER